MSDHNENIEVVVKEFRETLETIGETTADGKAKIAKMEADLDKFEEKSAKLTSDLLASRKSEEEQKERIDALEAKLARLPSGSADYKVASEEMKAMERYVLKGEKNMTVDELKFLRSDIDPDGGYLCPPEMAADLLKNITELSPVRQLARVQRTARGSIEINKRTSIPTAYRVGQGATDTQSQSAYGKEVLTLSRMTVDIPISLEQLDDSAFNMETEINTDAGEAFAVKEGAEFISGTGVGQFEGILVNASVANTNSGIANDIAADNFYDLQGALKRGYSGAFLFNRLTHARIRKLKDGAGAYLWVPMAAGAPATVAGDPYVITPDMPDIAAAASPVAYGDFQRGYRLADHVNTSILRDPYSQSRAGLVLYVLHRRNAGKVVLPEAIKKLTCAV